VGQEVPLWIVVGTVSGTVARAPALPGHGVNPPAIRAQEEAGLEVVARTCDLKTKQEIEVFLRCLEKRGG
jgi:hypothetical protein